MNQREIDRLVSEAKKAGHCPSCHEDAELGYAPVGECWKYLGRDGLSGPIAKCCCCDVLRMFEKLSDPAWCERMGQAPAAQGGGE